ncbi:MAG: methylated-DNA--[protein]-cysteine S-methyltransferase [Alphaproteobacteria bacterium]
MSGLSVGSHEEPALGVEAMQDDEATVSRAIAWLTRNYATQPSLAEAAAKAGMSPFHFQRVFSRHVGVSPKKFVQYLTLRHAKARLAEAASVLDAAYDSGLSGPGRLHDLFVTHESLTPGEWKTQAAGMVLRYGWHSSPFGGCLLIASDRGICGLGFADRGERAAAFADLAHGYGAATLVEDRAVTARLAAQAFDRDPAELHLVLRGTPFQLKVWEALLRIPFGTVVSYGDLAARLGRPDAQRAVAGAVARNPVSWLIPCHRVLRATGAITGYRWGPERKRAILAWEAARLEAG